MDGGRWFGGADDASELETNQARVERASCPVITALMPELSTLYSIARTH